MCLIIEQGYNYIHLVLEQAVKLHVLPQNRATAAYVLYQGRATSYTCLKIEQGYCYIHLVLEQDCSYMSYIRIGLQGIYLLHMVSVPCCYAPTRRISWCSHSYRHIFVANGHNVFKLTPVPYEIQVQQLVQQQHYDLAMQICVSIGHVCELWPDIHCVIISSIYNYFQYL